MQSTMIEIPLAFVLLIGVFSLCILIAFFPPTWLKAKRLPWAGMQDKMGLAAMGGLPFFLVLFVWSLLFAALTIGLLWVIADTASMKPPSANIEWRFWAFTLAKLASLTGVLGALVALPLSLVRIGLTRAQNETADDALYNEKMNAAVADLHAQRQVTAWYTNKQGPQRGQKRAENGWQDDITRRNGAIDTLRGLATNRPELLERIDQMLSVYLRELTREYPPEPVPKDASRDELRKWAGNLETVRSDMENAVVALSKLPRSQQQMMANNLPDLAEVNMQGFRLSEVALPKANLRGAKLQGADLSGAQLQGANLRRAKLLGADLTMAEFDNATSFTAAMPDWAALKEVNLSNVPQIAEHLQVMFGDQSVMLPKGVEPPDHWRKEDLDRDAFMTAWRDWQRAGGFDPDNPQ